MSQGVIDRNARLEVSRRESGCSLNAVGTHCGDVEWAGSLERGLAASLNEERWNRYAINHAMILWGTWWLRYIFPSRFSQLAYTVGTCR